MKKVGIYIRKSRDTKNEKSIKEQRLLGQEFCNENNYNSIIYNDDIVSGAGDTEKRPQYEQMLIDIEEDRLYGIYIWNTDRIARDEIAWHYLAKLLRDKNVYLFDNGVQIDLTDSNTILFYGVKSSMDAHFSRITSKKIKSVLHRNASEGKFSGILKYGYSRSKDGTTIINESEAEIVKEIFQLCIDGNGFKGIAEILNDKKIPTRYNQIGGNYEYDENKHGTKKNILKKSKSDAQWSSAVIGKILRSKNYIGERKYGGKIYKIPTIISKTQFNKAQKQIDNRKNKSGKKNNKFLLNDVLICSKCGKRYTGRKINKHSYYRCASLIKKGGSCGSSGLRMNILDTLIWRYFCSENYLIEHIKKNKMDELNQPTKESLTDQLTKLKKELITKTTERNNVTKYLIQDILNEKDAQSQLTRIKKEENDIDIKIEQVTEKLTKLSNIKEDKEQLKNEMKGFKTDTPFIDKKAIIDKHLEEIEIIDENEKELFTVILKFKIFNHISNITYQQLPNDEFNIKTMTIANRQ